VADKDQSFTFDVTGYRHPIVVRIDEQAAVIGLREKGGKEYTVPVGWLYLQAVKKSVSR
jgi:hypothetical protein